MGKGVGMPESQIFNLAEVESAIAGTAFAGRVHHLAATTSTNDVALKAAQRGERIGVWIADQQLAGRGRGAHTWHSPAGAGLYLTALAAPPVPMQSALALSLRVAIAVQSAIVTVTGFKRPDQIDIRWPNDLLLNGKKCGGILIDTASNPATASQPARLRYAVIGIGINVNQTAFPPELDAIATSLRRELPGQPESFTRSVENGTQCPPRSACRRHLRRPRRGTRAPATGDPQPASWRLRQSHPMQHLDQRQARPRGSPAMATPAILA